MMQVWEVVYLIHPQRRSDDRKKITDANSDGRK